MDHTSHSNLSVDRPLPSLLNLAQAQSHKKNEYDLAASAIASAHSFSSFVIPGAAAGSILNLLPELQGSSSKYYYDPVDADLHNWTLLDKSVLESLEPYAHQLSSSLYETYTFVNELSGPSGLRLAKTSRPLAIAAGLASFINKTYQKHGKGVTRASSDRTDSHKTIAAPHDAHASSSSEDKKNARFEYRRGGDVRPELSCDKDELLGNLNLQKLHDFILDIQEGNFAAELDIPPRSLQVSDSEGSEEMFGPNVHFKGPNTRRPAVIVVKPHKLWNTSNSTTAASNDDRTQQKPPINEDRRKTFSPEENKVTYFIYSGDGQKYLRRFQQIKESKCHHYRVVVMFSTKHAKTGPLSCSDDAKLLHDDNEEDVETLSATLNFHKSDHFEDYSVNSMSNNMEYLKDAGVAKTSSLHDELKAWGMESLKSEYYDADDGSSNSVVATDDERQRSLSVPNLQNWVKMTSIPDDDGIDETTKDKPRDKPKNPRIKLLKDTIQKKMKQLRKRRVSPLRGNDETNRTSRSTQKYEECMQYIKMCTRPPANGLRVTLYVQTPDRFEMCKLKTDFLIHSMKLFFSSPKDRIGIRSVSHIADELESIIEQYGARSQFEYDFENLLVCRAALVVPREAGILTKRRESYFLGNICEVLEIRREQLVVLLAYK